MSFASGGPPARPAVLGGCHCCQWWAETQAATLRYSGVLLQLVYASITALQLFAEESWASIFPEKALAVRQAAEASASKLLQQATKAISSPTHSLSRQHQWEQPRRAQSATQCLSQTVLRAWGQQLVPWRR